jgi:hypothetical protein
MAAAEVLRQPDISYHPNFASYQQRSQNRRETEKLPVTIPAGFPQKLLSTLVWDGKDVKTGSEWIVELNKSQLDEIDSALKHFKCTYMTVRVPRTERKLLSMGSQHSACLMVTSVEIRSHCLPPALFCEHCPKSFTLGEAFLFCVVYV